MMSEFVVKSLPAGIDWVNSSIAQVQNVYFVYVIMTQSKEIFF